MKEAAPIVILVAAVFITGFVIGHHEGFKLGESLGALESKVDCLADRVRVATRQR